MSAQSKRLYAIIIITVFSIIIVTGLGNYRAKQLAVSLAGDRVTVAISNTVKGLDPEKMKEVIKTVDEHHPYYAEIRKTLIDDRKEYGLKDICILYKDQTEGKWFYVADGREDGDPMHTPLGKIEKSASASVENTLKGKTVQGEHHVTAGGTLVSSYQEIKDKNGKIFAVLAGDLDAGELTQFLYLTGYVQIGILAAALSLIGIIVFWAKKKTGE
ncbi:MAG: hypothetical protein AWM53_01779 [Candidatus Dichloromethanomonas elyunquensis]|nr:MAG: hypothetical protein AWM53_01779 [Candidatus Dichloromethanomonas elyunquensis]